MNCEHCDKEAVDGEYQCLECGSQTKFEEIIREAFNIQVFSYSGEVDEDFFNVMSEVAEHRFNSEIAEKLGLKESHVELIQYLLCNNDHAEYGTSPRGCWLTDKGMAVFEQLKKLVAINGGGG